MKKTKLSLLILILILTVGMMIPVTLNAAQIDPGNFGSTGPSAEDVKSMYKFGGAVAGVVQVVGTMVAVGTMIIIGIRYVIASTEEKAEYKERMFPYFIGAVLLFGASNIVKIIYQMFN